MNSTCISDTTYFDSSEFLSSSLHITSAISTPIHLIAIYIILTKTPDYMKSIKWYLMNLHLWIILFDYSLGILTIPVLLLPYLAGFPVGLLANSDVPIILQVVWVFTLLAYVHVSITALFENRFYLICDFSGKKYWTGLRWLWLLAHYIAIDLIFSSFALLVPNQNGALESIFKKLPCLPSNFYEVSIFVLAEDYTYHFWACFFIFSTTSTEVFTFVCFIYLTFSQQNRRITTSSRTLNFQKAIFIALIIQMSVNAFLHLIPLLYAFISTVYTYYNQKIMNWCMIIISMHGFVSTLVMLLVHKPYRDELLGLIKQRSSRSQTTVQNIFLMKVTEMKVCAP